MSGSSLNVALLLTSTVSVSLGCWLGWKAAWRKALRANLDGIKLGADAQPTYERAEALFESCKQWADALGVAPPGQPEDGER
jgi:hypothetical protein